MFVIPRQNFFAPGSTISVLVTQYLCSSLLGGLVVGYDQGYDRTGTKREDEMPLRKATTKGFKRTSSLLTQRIRSASESRGFAQSRLLTHWSEVAGKEIADISRPVEVSYGRGGMGATLTLLTTGANAPVIEMEKEKLRARVNSAYGYNAIARIRVTQTAATGFSDGQVVFDHRNKTDDQKTTNPELSRKAQKLVQPVSDKGLRSALERLGENILNKETR